MYIYIYVYTYVYICTYICILAVVTTSVTVPSCRKQTCNVSQAQALPAIHQVAATSMEKAARPASANSQVAVKAFELRYHNSETILFTRYLYYGNFNSVPELQHRLSTMVLACRAPGAFGNPRHASKRAYLPASCWVSFPSAPRSRSVLFLFQSYTKHLFLCRFPKKLYVGFYGFQNQSLQTRRCWA